MAKNPEPDLPLNTFSIHYHPVNRGKGGALTTGFQHARGDFVSFRTPTWNTIRRNIPVSSSRSSKAVPTSFLAAGSWVTVRTACSTSGTYLGTTLTTFSNCLTNLNLTDMATCYKVFRREVIQSIAPTLKQNRFGFEPEITARVARRRCAIYEMSISYSGRTYEEGKKIGLKDPSRLFGASCVTAISRLG